LPQSEFPTPTPDRRCTALKADGEQCKTWALKGGTICMAHAGMSQGRKRKSTPTPDAEAERIALAAATGRLNDAATKLDIVDPLDPEAFTAALSERDRRAEELRRIQMEREAREAAKLERPMRTTQMATQGQHWVRHDIHPDHAPPPGAVFDPASSSWFVWRADVVAVPSNVPANYRPEDSDVARLRVERASAEDERREREVAKESADLMARYRECAGNGYAAAHYGRALGLDPDDYLLYLQLKIEGLHGRPVDLDGPMSEFHEVVLPALKAHARRNAWNGIGSI
jgi:hypothetical protein